MRSSPIRQGREIELDFLRGIAILLVIDFHSPRPILSLPIFTFGPRHPGWIGVDIFFVLSGFLVGGLLVKEWMLRGHANGRRFLIRRAFKIWPQYYVFLFYLLVRHHSTLYDLRGNLLNIQNYVGPFNQMWSLAVEEHAYIFLILLFAVASLLRSTARQLFLWLAGLSAIVITLKLVLTAFGFSTFAATHTRIDGIFYGVLLAMLYHFAPEHFGRLRSRPWLWALAVAGAMVVLRLRLPAGILVGLKYDAAHLLAVALLLLLYRPAPAGSHGLVYRGVAWIGLYSYGIYLWHVSVIAPLNSFASRFGWPTWSVAILQPVVGMALGFGMTRLIEFPMLRLRDRLFPRRVDSAVGIPAEREAPPGVESSLESR